MEEITINRWKYIHIIEIKLTDTHFAQHFNADALLIQLS
jgi:hypothetical protein